MRLAASASKALVISNSPWSALATMSFSTSVVNVETALSAMMREESGSLVRMAFRVGGFRLLLASTAQSAASATVNWRHGPMLCVQEYRNV